MMTLLEGMANIATQLSTPDDYFHGVSGPLSTLPHTILVFGRTRDWLTGEHLAFHHRFVLVAPLRGSGGVILDGRLCPLAPGQALLIHPYQSHYYTQLTADDLHWLFLTFAYDLPDELLPLRNHRLHLALPALEALSDALAAYLRERDISTDAALALALTRALAHLATSAQPPQHAVAVLPAPSDTRAGLVCEVSRFIHAHVNRPISPDEVAAHVALSTSHLRALFRQTVGISLGIFIRQAKIFAACNLLRTSDRRVTDIALACGYESVFSFSRAFRQVIGQSPQQFRLTRAMFTSCDNAPHQFRNGRAGLMVTDGRLT